MVAVAHRTAADATGDRSEIGADQPCNGKAPGRAAGGGAAVHGAVIDPDQPARIAERSYIAGRLPRAYEAGIDADQAADHLAALDSRGRTRIQNIAEIEARRPTDVHVAGDAARGHDLAELAAIRPCDRTHVHRAAERARKRQPAHDAGRSDFAEQADIIVGCPDDLQVSDAEAIAFQRTAKAACGRDRNEPGSAAPHSARLTG